jgi:hypothetical protein
MAVTSIGARLATLFIERRQDSNNCFTTLPLSMHELKMFGDLIPF